MPKHSPQRARSGDRTGCLSKIHIRNETELQQGGFLMRNRRLALMLSILLILSQP